MHLLYPGSDMGQHYSRNIAEWEVIPFTFERKHRSSVVIWQRAIEYSLKICNYIFLLYIRDSHSGVAEDSSFMGYYAMATGKYRVSFFRQISAGPTHHPTLCQRCVLRRMSARLNSRWLALDKQSQWHLTCRKSNNNSQERRAGAYCSSRIKTPYS